MKNKHFDKWEFDNAANIINSNPYEAKLRFENYISKYPNDCSAHIYYSFVLSKLGLFDETEHIINEAMILFEKNLNSLNKQSIIEIKKNYINAMLSLLSYQGKYKELLEFYSKHISYTKEMDINRTIFYCKKKLGLLDLNRRDKNSYIFRQTVEYKESDFLEHIKKHMEEHNINIPEPNDCVFYSDFPLKKVLEEIKKNIPSDKRIFPGNYDNLYVFKYNRCGKKKDKPVDFIKVVCFHDTKDIITMYPANDCENLPYTDLNYLNEEKPSPKAKRLSQIDKFNQRYKR